MRYLAQAYKHTEGPWHVDGGVVVDARQNVVAVRYSRRRLNADGEMVDGPGVITPCEADSNCHLMAAAPDLADAVRRLLTIVQAPPGTNDATDVYDACVRAEQALDTAGLAGRSDV